VLAQFVHPGFGVLAQKHNPNDEQMGSTPFGDTKLAGVSAIVPPPQIETNRGSSGRVSGCV
jgi:hypothetical protein